MSRNDVIDFSAIDSVDENVRLSDVPQFFIQLCSGAVPLLRNGPAPCASFAQRASAVGGTGPDVGNTTPGQPASWLATRGNVAASLMAANTSALPFSSALV